MEGKIGDRVSVDAKKVGQPRRTGVIRDVTKGLSGTRYQVRWDDGHESVLAPGGGNLTIEGRARGNGGRGATAKTKASASRKAQPRRKAAKRR